jgi:DNA-binding HxlR family transcriptional regulator
MPLTSDRGAWVPDPMNADCPSRAVIDLIADRWTILALSAIAQGAHRNGELLRHIGGISQKGLTRSLRGLERNGLVARHDYGEVPPRVDYHLTALGDSIIPLLGQLCDWAIAHMDAVATARESRLPG